MNSPRASLQTKILNVQLFIQQHLDEPLALERLAEIADYSPCHFHRLFRGQVGESADDYVRRLRLERAALSLRYRRQTVLEIALDAGYGSHEAFTRAFARLFGVTPSEYQSLKHPPDAIKEQLMNAVEYTATNVRIETQPARRMAFLRVVGPYNHATLGPGFGRIYHWAMQNNAFGSQTQGIGVYHDDPEVTDGSKQRADVGITVSNDFQVASGDEVQLQTVPGGTCAVLRHQGHYDTLGTAYRWLYSVWLPESGREPAKAPPYELYVHDCNTLPPEEWLTDICIPLVE